MNVVNWFCCYIGQVIIINIKNYRMRAILCLTVLFFSNVAAAQISVTDDIGQRVTLERPAKRIVSLAPHITENLFAAGAGDLIIGTVSYSDYPDAALSIPRVGSYNNINIELIASTRPDLVIAWREGNQKNQVEKLVELGIKVYVNYPQNLEDIGADIRKFGYLSGRSVQAEQESQRYNSSLEDLRKLYKNATPLSVFYQTWDKPLLTVNGKQLIGQIISLCGGQNIFRDLESLSPNVSVESVLNLDPMVIIASGMGESRPQWLDQWRQCPELKANRLGKLIHVPPSIIQRSTPRLLEGASMVCASLQEIRDNMQ